MERVEPPDDGPQEGRPDEEPPEAATDVPNEPQAAVAMQTGLAEAAPERQPGALRQHILTSAVAAGVLLFSLALFVAGFVTHALLD